MDKEEFMKHIIDQMNHYNSILGKKASKRFYFKTIQLNYSKTQKKRINEI
ncbi:MAG: hypothetical protein ACOX1V_04605 [Candidatus Iainarchaeum sp.]|jgi:hypothetical protein